MASVSFTGLLSHAKTYESIPDKWYPRMSSQHPSWPLPGRVHVLAASSPWQMTTCTVTFGFWTFIESAGADQCYCLTNQAVQELMPLCCLSDNNFVQFRCALVASDGATGKVDSYMKMTTGQMAAKWPHTSPIFIKE